METPTCCFTCTINTANISNMDESSESWRTDPGTMSSYAEIPSSPVDSLPSSSDASTTSVTPSEEEAYSDAEREWRESLQQLELLLTMVLVPYLGKYFGRRCAYWGKCARQPAASNSVY